MNWNKKKTCAFLLTLSLIAPLYPEDKPNPGPVESGYTINYNTIPILEYVRFASKICNVNFVYQSEELNFNVSVISDAPVTSETVMATLLQVLRINGMSLLEENGSLVIHKSPNVKQIGAIVSQDGKPTNAPIVTRIFNIKNAPLESMAAIIRPMISTDALIEVTVDSRLLIITDITASVDKVAALIEVLDSPHHPLEIKAYETLNNEPEFLIEMASQIMAPISQGNPFLLVPQPMANAIFIVSTPALVERATAILQSLDTPAKPGTRRASLKSENIFIYKTVYRTPEEVLKGLGDVGDSLTQSGVPEGDLLNVIQKAHILPDSNSILFAGSNSSLAKVKEFLTTIDTSESGSMATQSFFVYRPQSQTPQQLEKSILEMAGHLQMTKAAGDALINTLQSVKVNGSTQTLLFSGESGTFSQVKELLATMDSRGDGASRKGKNNFYIYKIQQSEPQIIEASLKNFAKTLDQSNAPDKDLIETIQKMNYTPETHSLLFTGPEPALQKLQEIVPTFDSSIGSIPKQNQFFIYKPKYQKGENLIHSLKELTENLKSDKFADPMLIQAISSAKWVKSTNSILFTGDSASIAKVEGLVASLDVPGDHKAVKPGYFIYKLQHTKGTIMEEELDSVAKGFKDSGMKDNPLVSVIENMRYVKETNSLILTGDPKGIEEAKALIAEYDHPRAAASGTKSGFFMYKPQHLAAPAFQKSLKSVAENLQKADLADPPLLAAISSSKYVEATNSIIFTGSPEALQKLQLLVKEVDIPPQQHAPIQHLGKTTFLLYKLKYASGPQIITSIKALTADLKKSGHSDADFLQTLQSVKYVKETNSLLFTGHEESLKKVESFVEKFDVTSLAAPTGPAPQKSGASNFFVYKPVSLPGPELEKVLNDFADNLKSSGLTDPDLFTTIESMRWVDKTQNLIFTGTPKSLDQVKQLLGSFDIGTNLPPGTPTGPLEPSIHGIDNTSFLVYKLQFHKGDEIQGALRQIAKDLTLSNAPINQNLLNSILSIQWLEVTNSLLCSGDQETLVRLRELIKNLDVPLKQVYIEMLVIETNLTNALQFGLEWGGKYKYRNKFQSGFNNTLPQTGTTCSTDQTMSTLNSLIPTNPPATITPSIGAPQCGFDLGIIGQVIKHNGQTFLTLGSLLSALQTDDESSVIITPKIITQDGRTSNIFVGQNIPFVGSFVNNQGNTTVQTSNLEYRDVGLNLTLTPVLGNSDIVTLDISLDRTQTVGDVNGNVNFTSQSAQGIVTSRTTMQTTVHVPDKNFLILSGFVNNSSVKSKAGIPCLGGLPLIGAAFSKDADTVSNTNIVIFLRPHVINSVDDMRRLTANEEDAFRDQQGTPFLIKQFDEGMELIKSIDDD